MDIYNFNTVKEPPTAQSPDGVYAVEIASNPGFFDTYVVENGIVKIQDKGVEKPDDTPVFDGKSMQIITSSGQEIIKNQFAKSIIKSADLIVKVNVPSIIEANRIFLSSYENGYITRVDWGDGTVIYTPSIPTDHLYASSGTYEIKISVDNNFQWTGEDRNLWWKIGFFFGNSGVGSDASWISWTNYNVKHLSYNIFADLSGSRAISKIDNFVEPLLVDFDASSSIGNGMYKLGNGKRAFEGSNVQEVNLAINLLPTMLFYGNWNIKSVIIRDVEGFLTDDNGGYWQFAEEHGEILEEVYISGSFPMIPAGFMSIGTQPRQKVCKLVIKNDSVPVLQAWNSVYGHADDIQIVVPAEQLEEYRAKWMPINTDFSAGMFRAMTRDELAKFDTPDVPDFSGIPVTKEIPVDKVIFESGTEGEVFSLQAGGIRKFDGFIPIPRQKGRINIIGYFDKILDLVSTSHVNVSAVFDGIEYRGEADIKVQGSTSIYYPQKNIRFKFTNVEGIRFGTWVATKQFDAKANWDDALSQAKNVAIAKLVHQMDMDRPINERFPQWPKIIASNTNILQPDVNISKLVWDGARCVIDGFAIEIYVNDQFYGLHTLNLSKEIVNFSLEANNQNHIWLDWGGPIPQTIFSYPVNWGEYEMRNPKDAGYVVGQAPTNPSVVNTITSFIQWINTTSNFAAEAKDHLWLDSWIDYHILVTFYYGNDQITNNMQMVTWDNQHWGIYFYDNGAAFGTGGNAWAFLEPGLYVNNNPVAIKVWNAFQPQVKARYAYLRNKGILSVENVERLLREVTDKFSIQDWKKYFARWPEMANYGTFGSTVEQMCDWLKQSLPAIDAFYGYTPMV